MPKVILSTVMQKIASEMNKGGEAQAGQADAGPAPEGETK
jgi:hypothetical protein